MNPSPTVNWPLCPMVHTFWNKGWYWTFWRSCNWRWISATKTSHFHRRIYRAIGWHLKELESFYCNVTFILVHPVAKYKNNSPHYLHNITFHWVQLGFLKLSSSKAYLGQLFLTISIILLDVQYLKYLYHKAYLKSNQIKYLKTKQMVQKLYKK